MDPGTHRWHTVGTSLGGAMTEQFSTDQFPDSKFRIHGRYELHLENGILVGTATGPFNLECLTAIVKARHAAIQEWKGDAQLQAITVFKSSMLMSPDALEAYSRGIERDFKNTGQLTSLAWVVGPEVEGRGVMMEHFAAIFARNQINWKVFDDLPSAVAWIGSMR